MNKKVQTVCNTAFVFFDRYGFCLYPDRADGKLKIYKMLALWREVVYDMQ